MWSDDALTDRFASVRFTGGLVGYFGYETINFIEPAIFKDSLPDPLATPDILLMVSEEVVIFDNLNGATAGNRVSVTCAGTVTARL